MICSKLFIKFVPLIEFIINNLCLRMGIYKIKNGLDLPIIGAPQQIIVDKNVKTVAVLGPDFIGMKPTMSVNVGDTVKLGQLLFTDKKSQSVKYTAPGSGVIKAINRGKKRALLSVVISLSGSDEITFDSYSENELPDLSRDKIVGELIDSGMWTSIRCRPFSHVANPEAVPHSIFVTAIDTNPLAPSVEKILEGKESSFKNGLAILSKLTEGKLFLCKRVGENIPTIQNEKVSVEEFSGPHPAGNVGTHIHFLDPVSSLKEVWHVGAQDVAAIGDLFTTGKINIERIVALSGSEVKEPRLLRTRLGASISELTEGELTDKENRIISGSVLHGRKVKDGLGFLCRYHQQISVIPEEYEREFLGWLTPGLDKYSVKRSHLSSLIPNKKFKFTTNANGDKRAIVPIGSYEKVMPLDILPTFLLRALAMGDIEESENLGALELDEEDLALCTFVCPSKIDHGKNLRRVLNLIEKEG